MALAQGLNELAFANSEGLLHDDEYRLLRQNLFERHSLTSMVPVEAPIVPVVGIGRNVSSSSSSHISRRQPGLESKTEPRNVELPPSHPKWSVSSSVARLLRRATGRKSPAPLPDHTTNMPIHNIAQRGGIPRTLQKKASDLFFVHTDSRRIKNESLPASPPSGVTAPDALHMRHQPYTRSVGHAISNAFPPKVDISSIADIYDDGNIHSVNDIRVAITATETEAGRVLEAFNNLEISTLRRIQQQTARRLPSTTPTHAGVLVKDTEWRDHSFQLPSSPRPSDRRRRIPSAFDVSDGASVRSGSSNKTSLSQSRSVSSLRSKQHPGSPLSSRFPVNPPSIHRKSSVSSISSQAPSSQRLGVNRSLSLSRSTGNLPLSMLTEKEGIQSDESMNIGNLDDNNIPLEVADIRKRSGEVAARYEARLEYLHAKLKGAKLHEKLMKK